MKYMLRRIERFDNSRAKMDVRFQLYREHTTLFRKRKVWKAVMVGAAEYSFPVSGDLEWAKKIAKHYKIEVPA